MTTNPDTWVYGDHAPDPQAHDLVGLKAEWVVNEMPASPTPALPDYGAGEGKYLHLIRKCRPAAALVGVDVRPARTAVDFEFHLIEPEAPLPFPDNRFDVVVSCDVLEHVASIEHSLDEIRRVLRSGGAFIGFVPLEGGFGPHAFFRLIDRNIFRDTKDHNQAYRRAQMLGWLSPRFRVVRLAYSYHLLGATLDAVFFASFKLPGVGSRMEEFWRGQDNPVYRNSAGESRPSTMGRLVQFASRLAYWESRLLSGCPYGAAGLLFHVEKP
jgi:SAM-dependent methyltransferase